MVFLELNPCSEQDADHPGFLRAPLAHKQHSSVSTNSVLYSLALDKALPLGAKRNGNTDVNLVFGIASHVLAVQVIQTMLILIDFF